MPAKGWWAGEVGFGFILRMRFLRRRSHAKAHGAHRNAAPAEPPRCNCRSHPGSKPREQQPPISTGLSLLDAQAASRGFALGAWGLFWQCPRSASILRGTCVLAPIAHGPAGALYASGNACCCLGSGGNPEGGLHLRPFLYPSGAQGPLFQKRAGAGAARGICRCDSHTHGASSRSHL